MTAIDWDQMSDKDFAKNLFTKLEALGPVFTLEDLDLFEDRLHQDSINRRAAFLVLTEPFSELQEKVQNDREFAVSTADILNCADSGLYQAVHDLLENARLRMAGMLACRADMEEVIKEAESNNPGGGL